MAETKFSLETKIGRIKLKNPVMVASGTFGYGEEFAELVDLKKLGAIVTKTITSKPRRGNPPPRIAETPCGMLNAIGLENPGIEDFIQQKLPFLRKISVPIIVSIGGDDPEEFVDLARRLDKEEGISGLELNISCPNITPHATRHPEGPRTTSLRGRQAYGAGATRYPLPATDYVLGKFSKEEKKIVKEIVAKATQAVETLIKEGIEKAMNEYNATGYTLQAPSQKRIKKEKA